MDALVREGEGVPDAVLLSEVSEDAYYANLQLRFQQNIIYTNIGNVCVSVNPFKQIAGLYSPDTVKKYDGRLPFEVPPHVFSVADLAYRGVSRERHNQAIIISGESGAGKTEASKSVMRYLAAVTPSSKSEDMDKIKDQLLDSNPILEAFGNAKTLRNDNSSRFGKYMKISFNAANFPVGGSINVYLLEKSRVVTRAMDERSFHIFYNLLAGADDGLLSSLQLQRDPAAYKLLSLSNCYTVDTINDKSDFAAVQAAMRTLEFPMEVQQALWRYVSAVLHLGQVEFTASGDTAVVSNENEVAIAAQLLNTDKAVLTKALLNRTVEAQGQSIVKPLDAATAGYARDSLCKTLYERCFLQVVRQINHTIENKTISGKEEVQIGLLDIYGFEVFEKNSFEQMMINYTNEKLQQVFIELTLKQEQEEYEREGIEWTPIQYFNNKVICDLIEAKPKGIIAFMDEACLMNKTEDIFLKSLGDNFRSHDHFEDFDKKKDKAIGKLDFRLKHYAGDVIYDMTGCLDKNTDQLFRDLTRALNASSDAPLKEMFPVSNETKKRPETAGTQFRRSVNELIDMLMACSPHYIRCIKPNANKRPDELDEELCRHQIRYLGLLENVRVRRAGFAYRNDYKRFQARYKMIGAQSWPSFRGGDDKAATEYLVRDEMGITSDLYRLGKTKVFLKDPRSLFSLEERRQKALPPILLRMQTQWRAYVGRKAYAKMRASAKIQAFARMWLAKKSYQVKLEEFRRDQAARVLQTFFLSGSMKKWFVEGVAATYANVKSDPNLGRSLPFPEPSKRSLRNAYLNVLAIYETWHAAQLVKRAAANRDEILMKVEAYNLCHGQKPFQPNFRYNLTNYVTGDNPKVAPKLAAKGLGEKLALEVKKVNTKSKFDARALVVTGSSISLLDPKSFKDKKQSTTLDQVVGIELSKHADAMLLVKMNAPHPDMALDLSGSGDRALHVALTLSKMTGKPVKLVDRMDYDNARPKNGGGSISFTADNGEVDEHRFQKGPKNQNMVHAPTRRPGFAYPGDYQPPNRTTAWKRSADARRKKIV
jgi:myosin-1